MRWALAAVVAAAAAPLCALDVPPTPVRYFTDFAGVVAAQESQRIHEALAELERRSGHQFIAVIFQSLAGEDLEDFTIRCAESWKVGRKGLDDGLIFFAFIADRRMRLEVGYGLEDRVTDALAARLLDGTVKPAFRNGDYGGGVLALSRALERVFAGEEPAVGSDEGTNGPPAWLLILAVMALLVLQAASRRSRRAGGFFPPVSGGWGGWGGGGLGGGGFSPGGGGFGGGGASGSW